MRRRAFWHCLRAYAALCASRPADRPPPCPRQALFDLEATNSELKNDLRDLYITSAQEIDVSSSRKAIVIHVSPTAERCIVCRHGLLAGRAKC